MNTTTPPAFRIPGSQEIQLPEDQFDLPVESLDEFPLENLKRPAQSRIRQVWAIGGGKGGIGKSMISSSLAIALARSGAKTVAIDLDLGAANLHTLLGVDLPQQTLSDFFSMNLQNLDRCLVKTGVPNLELISGAQDAVSIANLDHTNKTRLLQKIWELDADYVILDLGAGTNFNTIDFFLFADIGIVSLLPEPTSIENGYRFIKTLYYRRLYHAKQLSSVKSLIRSALNSTPDSQIKTPADLFYHVNRSSPEAAMRLKEEIEKFRPKLIVNQARTQADIDIGFSVRSVCKKYFGIEMDYVGCLDYDSAVWQAVRRKRPLLSEFPNSKLVSSIERIVNFLVKRHGHIRTNFNG